MRTGKLAVATDPDPAIVVLEDAPHDPRAEAMRAAHLAKGLAIVPVDALVVGAEPGGGSSAMGRRPRSL